MGRLKDWWKATMDPLKDFEDEKLIQHMVKRILIDNKENTYSNVRTFLKAKYEELSQNELKEEKDSLMLRKAALENDSHPGYFYSMCISYLALIAAIIVAILKNGQCKYLYYFLIGVIVFAISLICLGAKMAIKKAVIKYEIAYCTLALKVLKEMQPELFS